MQILGICNRNDKWGKTDKLLVTFSTDNLSLLYFLTSGVEVRNKLQITEYFAIVDRYVLRYLAVKLHYVGYVCTLKEGLALKT